jgi:hypothetical protein
VSITETLEAILLVVLLALALSGLVHLVRRWRWRRRDRSRSSPGLLTSGLIGVLIAVPLIPALGLVRRPPPVPSATHTFPPLVPASMLERLSRTAVDGRLLERSLRVLRVNLPDVRVEDCLQLELTASAVLDPDSMRPKGYRVSLVLHGTGPAPAALHNVYPELRDTCFLLADRDLAWLLLDDPQRFEAGVDLLGSLIPLAPVVLGSRETWEPFLWDLQGELTARLQQDPSPERRRLLEQRLITLQRVLR